MTRSEIRQAFAAQIAGAYTGTVITKRRFDAEDLTQFVQVNLSEGAISNDDDLNGGIVATVDVSIFDNSGDDDILDAVADLIAPAIEAETNFVPRGWAYSDPTTSDPYTSLTLTYGVLYWR